jgi:hypothetical protein
VGSKRGGEGGFAFFGGMVDVDWYRLVFCVWRAGWSEARRSETRRYVLIGFTRACAVCMHAGAEVSVMMWCGAMLCFCFALILVRYLLQH